MILGLSHVPETQPTAKRPESPGGPSGRYSGVPDTISIDAPGAPRPDEDGDPWVCVRAEAAVKHHRRNAPSRVERPSDKPPVRAARCLSAIAVPQTACYPWSLRRLTSRGSTSRCYVCNQRGSRAEVRQEKTSPQLNRRKKPRNYWMQDSIPVSTDTVQPRRCSKEKKKKKNHLISLRSSRQ